MAWASLWLGESVPPPQSRPYSGCHQNHAEFRIKISILTGNAREPPNQVMVLKSSLEPGDGGMPSKGYGREVMKLPEEQEEKYRAGIGAKPPASGTKSGFIFPLSFSP
jgi:hypothetical protein